MGQVVVASHAALGLVVEPVRQRTPLVGQVARQVPAGLDEQSLVARDLPAEVQRRAGGVSGQTERPDRRRVGQPQVRAAAIERVEHLMAFGQARRHLPRPPFEVGIEGPIARLPPPHRRGQGQLSEAEGVLLVGVLAVAAGGGDVVDGRLHDEPPEHLGDRLEEQRLSRPAMTRQQVAVHRPHWGDARVEALGLAGVPMHAGGQQASRLARILGHRGLGPRATVIDELLLDLLVARRPHDVQAGLEGLGALGNVEHGLGIDARLHLSVIAEPRRPELEPPAPIHAHPLTDDRLGRLTATLDVDRIGPVEHDHPGLAVTGRLGRVLHVAVDVESELLDRGDVLPQAVGQTLQGGVRRRVVLSQTQHGPAAAQLDVVAILPAELAVLLLVRDPPVGPQAVALQRIPQRNRPRGRALLGERFGSFRLGVELGPPFGRFDQHRTPAGQVFGAELADLPAGAELLDLHVELGEVVGGRGDRRGQTGWCQLARRLVGRPVDLDLVEVGEAVVGPRRVQTADAETRRLDGGELGHDHGLRIARCLEDGSAIPVAPRPGVDDDGLEPELVLEPIGDHNDGVDEFGIAEIEDDIGGVDTQVGSPSSRPQRLRVAVDGGLGLVSADGPRGGHLRAACKVRTDPHDVEELRANRPSLNGRRDRTGDLARVDRADAVVATGARRRDLPLGLAGAGEYGALRGCEAALIGAVNLIPNGLGAHASPLPGQLRSIEAEPVDRPGALKFEARHPRPRAPDAGLIARSDAPVVGPVGQEPSVGRLPLRLIAFDGPLEIRTDGHAHRLIEANLCAEVCDRLPLW